MNETISVSCNTRTLTAPGVCSELNEQFWNFWAPCYVGTVSNGSACQAMSSVTVPFLCWGWDEGRGLSPKRWIKLRRLVFRPLPKMINPYREHYWALSGCAFSLPVIVLFLLLPSSVSLPITWKEEKNVWIEEGDFPTVTQLRKIHHCRQVPIPVPRCTVCRSLTDSVPTIEWPFFLLLWEVSDGEVKCDYKSHI